MAFLVAGAAAIVGDQSSKALMGRLLPRGPRPRRAGRPGFTWTRNRRGSAVALPLGWTVLVWIAAFAAAALVVAIAPSVSTGAAVGLGLAVGGAAGVLADRLTRGGGGRLHRAVVVAAVQPRRCGDAGRLGAAGREPAVTPAGGAVLGPLAGPSVPGALARRRRARVHSHAVRRLRGGRARGRRRSRCRGPRRVEGCARDDRAADPRPRRRAAVVRRRARGASGASRGASGGAPRAARPSTAGSC